ncbi:hypothetical protein BCR34DRAFT_623602 [Clohesyomyces aquaticus]|uniref:Malate dehydrogenase n=1 Tax=Clohesyomyces aquaticus TaxID=1231657 RepID=A0A1Y1ZUS6_9PLEO|nr:hypothetical protein BCR34DRAFT_623602 [Clohesyomyces aquaticus]
MIFTNTITLILALAPAAIFAAPTRVSEALTKAIEDSNCDLSGLKMPIVTAPTPLPSPAPGLTLSHVAVGRGTQNYTCPQGNPQATPSAVGAIAELFNATCWTVRAPEVFAKSSAIALNYTTPTGPLADAYKSGHHLFTAAGVPWFVLNTDAHHYGDVQAKKNASSSAPADAVLGSNGMGSVPWLKLNAVSGDYKEVYRLNTAGGQPPKTCAGYEGNFEVQYAAEYWFWN